MTNKKNYYTSQNKQISHKNLNKLDFIKLGLFKQFIESFKWKHFFIQIILVLSLLFSIHYFCINVVDNLTRQHIASGFDFLNMRAGITIPDSLIPYSVDSTNKTALFSGLVNTLFMSVLCIIFATFMGFLIAFGRLSKNWLMRKICFTYIEVFRNIPVLLVILFFYFGILQQYLPAVRDSIELPFHVFINQRGIYFPAISWGEGISGIQKFILPSFLLAFAILLPAILRYLPWSFFKIRKNTSYLTFFAIIGICIYLLNQSSIDFPKRGRFNISGGSTVTPEFFALLLGLSFYSAALIAETVRAGVEGVNKNIQDAAYSLGMTKAMTVKTVIVPLAMRIIIPPLSGQYMNIAKNTSLAIAIGYSDLMRVGNSILIQTNQSIEIVIIWIVAYLAICLVISSIMNILNYRLLKSERLV